MNVRTVKEHLRNIFNSDELQESSVIRITAGDRINYNTKFYKLEVIIAVGYGVNSAQAIQFRMGIQKR